MEILLGILVVAGIAAALIYNRLVSLRQNTKNAFADIDVQLKQRADLIPNLVETVKGYAKQESDVFTKVTEARAKAMNAHAMADRSAAESQLSGALANLMAVAESYPELKSNQNFLSLQAELSDTENKIAAARRYLNNSVAEYNASIEQFPSVFIAKRFGFTEASMFVLEGAEKERAEQPPTVSFS